MLDGLTMVLEWYEELQHAAAELLAEIDAWDVPQTNEIGVYGKHTALGRLRYVVEVIDRIEGSGTVGPDDQQMNEWNQDRNEH